MAVRGRPFKAGEGGNPAGRPKGSRNKTTVALEAILQGEAETITRKAIEMAQEGDTVALRLCLDRLLPVRKDRPITFELPEIATAADLTAATSALLKGVAEGDITPSEAAELGKLLDVHIKAIETRDFSDRLAKLEERTGGHR